MLDNLTLDQLRTFIAAADAGSVSAAGRKLGRAQSVVSQTLANLEAQTGVVLFDRSGRYPVPTKAGTTLLSHARATIAVVETFKREAKGLSAGLEPEVAIVVDVLFPFEVVTVAVAAFIAAYPSTALRLQVEALGAVIAPVLEGRCAFAISGSLPILPDGLVAEPLRSVDMIMVASPSHPLARHAGLIPCSLITKHVQLVLSDRSELSKGREFGVLSPKTWRLADLGAKHAFLRSGLGWGGMPLNLVADDLAKGDLVRLEMATAPLGGLSLPMSAVYRAETPPGPAGRWLIAQLRDISARTQNVDRADAPPDVPA